jgi:hypothetical protein
MKTETINNFFFIEDTKLLILYLDFYFQIQKFSIDLDILLLFSNEDIYSISLTNYNIDDFDHFIISFGDDVKKYTVLKYNKKIITNNFNKVF